MPTPPRSPAVTAALLIGLTILTAPAGSFGAGEVGASGASDAWGGTPVPAATPAPPSKCGDGMLSGDETCESCPADCQPSTCKTEGRRKVTVELSPQNGYDSVGAVTVLLAYRHGVLSLPGERNAPAASARVKARQKTAQVFVNDLGYALRIVVSDQKGLPAGPVLDVDLDTCSGVTAAPGDLNCRVESCAHGGGRLRGCSCSVSLP